MTDREIVKALECCRTNIMADCKRCNLRLEDGTTRPYCTTILIGNALDLINRLQARVEKCEKVEHFADKTIATLQAENERLKKGWKADILLTAKAKAEAYKEFANKLKTEYAKGINWFGKKEHYFVETEDIDNLLKELVGGGGCDTCKSLTCDGCELYEELVGEDK